MDIQQGLLQIMTPVFEPGFSDSSYGFRPNRSAHDAVEADEGVCETRIQCSGRYGYLEVLRQC
ncbi:hypothetical protein DBT_0447 [Dissulfuribacter thermophilus]|uniref:Retron-type RNA-directed DNA polymerase n=1 Tax=Dissulfuribacter thermophilus TaxID=1156395 RepID=A0A1B9F850_9BACT|nr:hypothetical protein DBT_0447 [Dissulfuribacter thermophilus]